ncbi:hypothetical protein B0H19DRAFT_614633 [Mycena capillaripes]|nr:hypothetical protein B0H19DRAFT_614633 [Mycena capillaripes]
MARLLFLALSLGLVQNGLAGPACAEKHKTASDCMLRCNLKWGFPGLMMGTDPWGTVMHKTGDSDEAWDKYLALACGEEYVFFSSGSGLGFSADLTVRCQRDHDLVHGPVHFIVCNSGSHQAHSPGFGHAECLVLSRLLDTHLYFFPILFFPFDDLNNDAQHDIDNLDLYQTHYHFDLLDQGPTGQGHPARNHSHHG